MLRHTLGLLAGATIAPALRAHEAFGPLTPARGAPALAVASTSRRAQSLVGTLHGRTTALQLMFTGCSATCPIQGAVFAETQRLLADATPELQLLSVSIDPLGDDIGALRGWLQRFGADPRRWTAARLEARELDVLLEFLRGRAVGVDRHTAQAYIFDRDARLVYRTQDMPPAEHLAALMKQISTLR